MEWIFELMATLVLELFVQGIIVGFFGYYTMLGYYTLTGNKTKVVWLKTEAKKKSGKWKDGCSIGIVGFISFCVFVYIVVVMWGNFW